MACAGFDNKRITANTDYAVVKLVSHNRYRYSPIGRRPLYDWPGGKRLAVYIALNLEHFSFGEGLGAELAPGGPQPDVLNYAWCDWGNRVGAWRMLDLFRELAVPVSLLANSSPYDYGPELIAAYRDYGAEMVAHGRTNSERQGTLEEAQEATLIAECTAAIARHERRAPEGCARSLDLAKRRDAGPAQGSRLQVPARLVPRRPAGMVRHPQRSDPVSSLSAGNQRHPGDCRTARFGVRIRRHDDRSIRRDARAVGRRPLVCGVALHAYITGQPFRLRHLRRALQHIAAHRERIWLTTSGAIARHIEGLPADIVAHA